MGMRKSLLLPLALFAAFALRADVRRLSPDGGRFVDASGRAVRFWGVNLVSCFPDPEDAPALADELAALGVNLVRPHHTMRRSADWIRRWPVNSLLAYAKDSREQDAEAWRRFDALNAALRKRGIWLQLTLHGSRRYDPGDADILPSDPADAKAWAESVAELNARPWQKRLDVAKVLPIVDARAKAVYLEAAEFLLRHRNPYTGLTYAEDPQVLTLEVLNECSLEYALVCGNQLPDYMNRRVQAGWEEYARANGVAEPGDHRAPEASHLKRLRQRYYRSLDAAFFREVREFARGLGCGAAVAYSNLWRGEDELALAAAGGDYVEDHAYVDPFVARSAGDWMDAALARTHLAGKPYILGEFNEAEGEANIRLQSFARTQLALAAAAYGCYQGVDGFAWFAYQHGDLHLAKNGRSADAGRSAALGDLCRDGQLLDHFPLLARIFRNGYIREAGRTVELLAPVPQDPCAYSQLMRGSGPDVPPGLHSVAGVRRRQVPKDGAEPQTPLPAAPGENGLFTSDTREIFRDVELGQLCVVAPCVEAFSGFCTNGTTRAEFRHLETDGFLGRDAAFATVLVVSGDRRPLGEAKRILVSRTGLDAALADGPLPPVALRGLGKGMWRFRVKRPLSAAKVLFDVAGLKEIPLEGQDGRIALPAAVWTQLELTRR